MKEKITSEFLGTYFLVFAGTGAVIIDDMTKKSDTCGGSNNIWTGDNGINLYV